MARGYSPRTEAMIADSLSGTEATVKLPASHVASEADLASALEAADPSRMTLKEIDDLEQATSNLVAEGGPDAA